MTQIAKLTLPKMKVSSEKISIGDPVCYQNTVYNLVFTNVITGMYNINVALNDTVDALLQVVIFHETIKPTDAGIIYIVPSNNIFGVFSETDFDNPAWLIKAKMTVFANRFSVGSFDTGIAWWSGLSPAKYYGVQFGLNNNKICAIVIAPTTL